MTSRPLLRGWSDTHTHTHTHTHSLTLFLTHHTGLTPPFALSRSQGSSLTCPITMRWEQGPLLASQLLGQSPPPPQEKLPLEWPSLCLPFPLQLQLPQSSRVPSGLGEGARSGETISPASPALSRPRSEMKVVTQSHGRVSCDVRTGSLEVFRLGWEREEGQC